MDTKISLVPTNTIRDEPKPKTYSYTRNKGDNYKPYKGKGRYQGGYKKKNSLRGENSYGGEQDYYRKREDRYDQGYKASGAQEHVEGEGQAYQEEGYGYNDQNDYYGMADPNEHRFTCEFPRAKDYSDLQVISQTFPHLKEVNSEVFEVTHLQDVRCFIMRSNNEDDIHKAVKYGIWTSTPKSNEYLNNVYEECTPKNIPIFLFYSVVRSGQFVAVAQMTSKIIEKSFQFWWEGDKWVNHFQVKWIFVKDVAYKHFSHLYMDDDVPVTRARDCTNVPLEVAKEMLTIYRDYNPYNSIFNAFPYMDVREDMLRYYKNSMQMYQRFYANAKEQFNQAKIGQPGATTGFQGQQQTPQYFKYNSFPTKTKEAQTAAEKKSPKKGPASDLNGLYDEFDHTYKFFNDERIKWEKDLAALKAGKGTEDIIEELRSREKEILEGLDLVNSKYTAVEKTSNELLEKSQDKEFNDSLQKKVKEIASLAEKLKAAFEENKKVLATLAK